MLQVRFVKVIPGCWQATDLHGQGQLELALDAHTIRESSVFAKVNALIVADMETSQDRVQTRVLSIYKEIPQFSNVVVSYNSLYIAIAGSGAVLSSC